MHAISLEIMHVLRETNEMMTMDDIIATVSSKFPTELKDIEISAHLMLLVDGGAVIPTNPMYDGKRRYYVDYNKPVLRGVGDLNQLRITDCPKQFPRIVMKDGGVIKGVEIHYDAPLIFVPEGANASISECDFIYSKKKEG